MEIRKAMTGAVMIGAIGAAGLGLAGTASASPYKYTPKPKTTYSYQSVVVRDNGQVGNGNTTQSATGSSGAISNPQIGVGLNVGAQIPLSLNVLAQKGVGNQDPSLSQTGASNTSSNSTSVNTSAENGNHSTVNIGN
jgi:hypothetical protein